MLSVDTLSTSHKAPVVTLAIRRTDSDDPERVIGLEGTPVLIGRAPTCLVNLTDQTVSRQHAELTRLDDGTWTISRSKTAQRVWVDGVSVDTAPLRGGETIRIGPYTMQLRLSDSDGQPAEVRRSDRSAGPASDTRPPATLVIETGSPTPGRLPLVKPVTVMGGSDACDVVLVDRTGPAEHAAIHRIDDGFVLRDLGSTSGVFLNGHRITSDTELAAGDIIDIGTARMTFVVDGAAAGDVFATASTSRPAPQRHDNVVLRMFSAWQRWPAAWQVGTAATLACAIVAMATVPTVISRTSKQLAAAKQRQIAKKTAAPTPSAVSAETPPSTPTVVDRDVDRPTAPSDADPDAPVDRTDSSLPQPDSPQPASGSAATDDATADDERPAMPPRTSLKDLLDEAERTAPSEDPPVTAASSPQPPAADPQSVAVEQASSGPTTRLPVPPKDEIDAALEKVDAVYAEDFAAPGQLPLLLPKLIDAANKSVKPANKFALLLAAEREAVEAASFRNAMDVLTARAAAFDIDALQARLELLIEGSKSTGDVAGDVLPLAIDVANEALADERFDIATKASTLASTVATEIDQSTKARAAGGAVARPASPTDPSSVADENAVDVARRLRLLVTETKKLHQKYETALAALQENPEDEKSHEIVGKYRCFVLGDWPKGLPALAASREAPLCDLAARELELNSQSADVTAVFTLAGEWWSFADAAKRTPSLPSDTGATTKKHAAELYARIVANLDDPLEAELARKRIATAASEPTRRRPAGR